MSIKTEIECDRCGVSCDVASSGLATDKGYHTFNIKCEVKYLCPYCSVLYRNLKADLDVYIDNRLRVFLSNEV